MFFSVDSEEWRLSARCAEIGGDLWFPEESCVGNDAKSICEGCPVQFECLETALENNEKFGIWGGLSPNQRKKIMRQRRLAG